MENRRIRVLVVEDSTVVQLFLVHLLKSDPYFEVIGTAADGAEAVEFVARNKPDVVLMDVHMPRMDGIEATRRIMQTDPVPIVVTSATLKSEEVSETFAALEAGALAFVEKASGPGSKQAEENVRQLKQTLRLMSEVNVVRRWRRGSRPSRSGPSPAAPPAPASRWQSVKLVAIGASTGGPSALQAILGGLSKKARWPILIVQHISAGFLQGLAEWLTQTSGIPVHIACSNMVPAPGQAYLAPDDFQMGVDRAGRIQLAKAEPEGGLRPAVGYLFRSAAAVYGPQAVGVLLTGMGKDGAADLKLMKERGALTIAQDQESSVVYGMPGEAVGLGAATCVLSPEEIAATLSGLA